MLTTFLWSNEDSDSLWNSQTLVCDLQNAEVAKRIDFLLSDKLPSTLLWYRKIFRFWTTSSPLFGMSSLSAILLIISYFQGSSCQYCFATSANWLDMARPVFVKTRLLLTISLKISRVSSSTR